MTFDGTCYTYSYNSYDNLGEVLQTQQYQAATPWTVNPAGDLLLSQSSTAYDALGEVYQSTEYLVVDGVAGTAEITSYSYDADGNEVSLTDPDYYETTWQYDGLGDMTAETNAAQTDAIGENDQYRFDAAGEVTEKIDADGRAIVYSYDGIGRESAENWYASVDSSGNPQGDPTETIAYTYNPAGLLFTASDASAAYTYTYLCPCQLAGVDFFRAAVFFSPGREKRVGGAGGGASSPCSPARGGRKRRTLRTTGAGDWQDACPRGAKVGALGGRWQDTVEVRFLLAS
jgi:YD repeat-containing protein